MVASIAQKTPDHDYCLSVHHIDLLKSELLRQPLMRLKRGPFIARPTPVQLGENSGVIFKTTDEQEAMIRWMDHRFLEAEREYAKKWRQQLSAIDLQNRVANLKACIGNHWRTPTSLEDARAITDIILKQINPANLIAFGLAMFGLSALTDAMLADWVQCRRPPLDDRFWYLSYLLSVNIFFALALPAQLLRNVKESHVIDLAYLYYLPFCEAFTSEDDFHVKIVPFFLGEKQTFIKGSDLKQEMKKLDQHYSALDPSELAKGMTEFARHPPDDTSFLTTQLWDKYIPQWRTEPPPIQLNEQLQQAIKQMVDSIADSTEEPSRPIQSMEDLAFLSMQNKIFLSKGKYRRHSEEMEQRIIANEKAKATEA